MKTYYIKIILSIVACLLLAGKNLHAQNSSSNSLEFNFEESKSHFYQMVKRPSLIIAPKVGMVFNETGYLAEFGLISARTTPGRTFGFSLSYITASKSVGDPLVTNVEFSQNRVLETTSEPEINKIGLRASILIPMSSSWFLTVGGGANMLTTETTMTQRYFEYQGEIHNSHRLLIEQSSLTMTDHSWEPVASIGLKTYFGNVLNIGTYVSALVEEDFYNSLQIGVSFSINLAGL